MFDTYLPFDADWFLRIRESFSSRRSEYPPNQPSICDLFKNPLKPVGIDLLAIGFAAWSKSPSRTLCRSRSPKRVPGDHSRYVAVTSSCRVTRHAWKWQCVSPSV